MRVIYRKTILEYIQIERVRALMEQREIEKIVLSLQEARKLLDELGCAVPCFGEMRNWYSPFEQWLYVAEKFYNYPGPQPGLKAMGIEIEVSR